MQTKSALRRTAGFVCALFAFLTAGSAELLHAFPVQLAEAPGTQLEMTLSAIHSARKSLFINIYEMTEPTIADAIEERIRAGVHVEILLEGQPVGGRSTTSQALQAQLIKAMRKSVNSGSRFYEMTSRAAPGRRRYRFDHAKYILTDGSSLLISSENFTPTGNPQPGTLGNRGWQVRVFQSELARQFFQLFRKDSDSRFGDILSWVDASDPSRKASLSAGLAEEGLTIGGIGPFGYQSGPPSDASPDAAPEQDIIIDLDDGAAYGAFFRNGTAFPVVNAAQVQKILSPDTSLSRLVQMIRSARHSIDVQQMSFYSEWKSAGTQSPLVTELVAAAGRGVAVRVLLNDDLVFLPPGSNVETKNRATVRALNQLARSERLKISAKIADLKAMGVTIIHNKGAIIDGAQVLISSINWNENSVTNNREAALLIKSAEAASYYGQFFDHDWRMSRHALPPTSAEELQAWGARQGLPIERDPD